MLQNMTNSNVSTEFVCLIIVGMFWGCTNPLIRKGSLDSTTTSSSSVSHNRNDKSNTNKTKNVSSILNELLKFRFVRVILPYIINQLGSLFFYFTLSNTNLSVAVPVCNALALVFSIVTCWMIGEHVNYPIRSMLGSIFILIGVMLCVDS